MCENHTNDKTRIAGLGITKADIKKTQASTDIGLVSNILVLLACGSTSETTIVGNVKNFWYGILDFENVIVELINAGVSTAGNKRTIVGWENSNNDGGWTTSEDVTVKDFDECYKEKLPKLAEQLKANFSGGALKNEPPPVQLQIKDVTKCENKKFGNSVMTVYTKEGKNNWQNGTSDWGKFKGSYGERLSNVRVGEGVISTGEGKNFYELPKKVTFKLKS